MKHKMPPLKYQEDALSPKMSAETLQFHHGKHEQTYFNTMNTLIEGTEYENMSLEDIVKKSDGKLFNNAAQSWNHVFFFDQFSANPQPRPSGNIAGAIEDQFGSFEGFKKKFTEAGTTLFGSGWVWLYRDNQGNLKISQESNAGNPLKQGYQPIMTCDVWEHAYYIDYRNKLPDYLEAFWNILDWAVIESRYL
ncbi:MAG: superoxide dismutase [Rikenellaceae bacterium]|nr:superoxide dismutase [Rikenellaceae bacterium]